MKGPRLLLLVLTIVTPAGVVHSDDRWPADWGGGPAGYEVARDSEIKLSGNSCVRLSKSELATRHNFGTVVQAIDARRFVGKRIRFSGYVKARDVTGSAGLWLRIDSKERGTVAFDNMRRRPIEGTRDWYKYEIVLDVPDDGAMIHFGALLAGEGTIWLDDLSLEAVSPEIELTSPAIQPTNRSIEIPRNLAVSPKNLSFES